MQARKQKPAARSAKAVKKPDDFASVAARLECDPDLKKFDAKLKKIARTKPKAK